MARGMPSSRFLGASASGSVTDLRRVGGNTFCHPSAAVAVAVCRWDEKDAAWGSGYNTDLYVLTPTGEYLYVNGPYGPGEPGHWVAHEKG